MPREPGPERTVLVLAGCPAEQRVVETTLATSGMAPRRCAGIGELAGAIWCEAGGVAVVTEESLAGCDLSRLHTALAAQPDWSELPIVLLAAAGDEAEPVADELRRSGRCTVAILELPVNAPVLTSTVEMALRARSRQIRVRDEVARRRETEQSLRAIQERLRRAQQAGSVGTWETTSTGDSYWSEGMWTLFGRSVDSAEDPVRVFRSSLHPDDARHVLDAIDSCMGGGELEYDEEFRIVRPDGSVRWIHSVADVFRPTDVEGVLMAGVSIDVTERKGFEAVLEEADRRKNEFLAALGHELRNPLASLQSGYEIVRMTDDPAILEETFTILERQMQYLTRLVDDLLDVSRITQGKLKLRKSQVEIEELVRGAIHANRSYVDAGRHDLVVRMPDGPLVVEVDPIRVSQVLNNLLSNAAKYTPPGGRIELEIEARREDVRVSVRDDGRGLRQEHLETIFEMFRQLDHPEGTSQHGLGIGLALSRTIIEMHGGTIEAHSDGPGRGSEFVVVLPATVKAEPQRSAAGDRDAAAEGIAGVPRRVLVIEDNADAACTLAQLISMLGHEVRVAHDGDEGLTAAAAFRPHVALLDLGLPKLNGYDVARRIREMDAGRPIALVAVTGWGQETDRHRALAAGFDRHVAKPLELEVLCEILRDAPTDVGELSS